MRWDLFLLGFHRFFVSGESAAVFFDACRRRGLHPRGVGRTGEGVVFLATSAGARSFLEVAAQVGASLEERGVGGVPHLFCRLVRRPGLLLGLVLSLALFVAAHFFLFEVEITGLEGLDEGEVRAELAAVGLYPGRFLPRLDTDGVEAALRQGDGRISFVTVNRTGTVAHVQIKESVEGEKAPSGIPANLVAKRDGVITSPLVFEGECLVREGDVVREGQLLVSGISDTANHGFRVTRAAGKILARVSETYTVRVPYSFEEKVPTGRKECEVSLFFFQLGGKVFKNSRKDIMLCDIIEDMGWLSLGGKRLPLGFLLTTRTEYTLTPATRNVTKARALAFSELELLLSKESAGRALLGKTVEIAVDGEGVVLYCTACWEEDIAATVEFELNP